MQTFKGIEYVKIAIANAYGLDKKLFQTRIDVVDTWLSNGLLTNADILNMLTDEADEPALFTAGIIALQDALAGKPSGFMVGLDACASGIQIMGALINCETTCRSTGLINPNVRADIYTAVNEAMSLEFASQGIGTTLDRSDVKEALMTHFYGSKEKPKEVFGEDSVELEIFYDSLDAVARGAVMVMEHLLAAWQPFALEHSWKLPDGFDVVVKVMDAVDFKVEVDELDHATFTHRIYENQGTEKGLSIAANVVHSIDGMVVREMNRRCNYDEAVLTTVKHQIERELGDVLLDTEPCYDDFVSIRMADDIYTGDLALDDVSDDKIVALYNIICRSLNHKSFPIICVHDEFKCSPNNMNHLRQHYIDIFVELSKSNLLADILAQIHGVPKYNISKFGDVSTLISQSNYALS